MAGTGSQAAEVGYSNIECPLFRDEQGILERFVRHTLYCVDGLLIVISKLGDADSSGVTVELVTHRPLFELKC